MLCNSSYIPAAVKNSRRLFASFSFIIFVSILHKDKNGNSHFQSNPIPCKTNILDNNPIT